MSKLRKSMLGALVALAALALSAPVASAWEFAEVRDQETEELCPAVVVQGVDVDGGCLVEGFAGSFRIHHPTSGESWLYDSTFDVRVGSNGMGYAVNPTVGSNPYLQRVACDDAQSNPKPWAFWVRSVGGGSFEAILNICVRSAWASPGSSGSSQWITLDVGHFGADGWTELDQSDSTLIQSGHWESENTVDISEI